MGDLKDTADNRAIAAQLASTQTLMQQLLKEIRDSSVSQASLKTELKQLRYNVTMLSNIIRGGDAGGESLLTEVALLKRGADEIEGRMDELEESVSGQLEQIQSSIGSADRQRREDETSRMTLEQTAIRDDKLDKRQRLNTYATILVALIALAGSILALILRNPGP